MNIEELKETIRQYDGSVSAPDDEFISLVAVEQVLKSKHLEFLEKQEEYEKHLSNLLGSPCKIRHPERYLNPYEPEILVYDSFFSSNPSIIKVHTNESVYFKGGKIPGRFNASACKKINKDTKTKEFMSYCRKWANSYRTINRIKTDLGLFIDIFQMPNRLMFLFSDRDITSDEKQKYGYEYSDFCWNESQGYGNNGNFFYIKDILTDERFITYKTDMCKQFLNESQIANLYTSVEVDASGFSQELRSEMEKFENYYKLQLHKNESKELEKVKQLQLQRILECYRQFREAAMALNNLKMEVNLEKIKLDDLGSIFFKNNGLPNEMGYIEISDMFKENMLLRMVDLSGIDLTNVDIRNMDFSGTNIKICPQKIYNKDMTNVNALGIKFSPFTDKFDDVILDGAKIDDWEAMINLEKVKSYNRQTVIPGLSEKNKTR